MWFTVGLYLQEGHRVPQFHGKVSQRVREGTWWSFSPKLIPCCPSSLRYGVTGRER